MNTDELHQKGSEKPNGLLKHWNGYDGLAQWLALSPQSSNLMFNSGLFCVEFTCFSFCACLVFLQALWFPATLRRHAGAMHGSKTCLTTNFSHKLNVSILN